MIRITPLWPRQNVRCLRVEGRLVGDCVSVLHDELRRIEDDTCELELDLADVEFADSEALTLLLDVAQRGVKLVACSPLLTSLLESKAP